MFHKKYIKNRNHTALIYFHLNNHMYRVLEDAVRKSLVEKPRVRERFRTSLLENEAERKSNNIHVKYN
jgi:hypothetical protein